MAAPQRELVEEVGLEADEWELLADLPPLAGLLRRARPGLPRPGPARRCPTPPGRRGGDDDGRAVAGGRRRRLVADGTVHDAKTCIGLLLAKERLCSA